MRAGIGVLHAEDLQEYPPRRRRTTPAPTRPLGPFIPGPVIPGPPPPTAGAPAPRRRRPAASR